MDLTGLQEWTRDELAKAHQTWGDHTETGLAVHIVNTVAAAVRRMIAEEIAHPPIVVHLSGGAGGSSAPPTGGGGAGGRVTVG